MVLDAGNAYPSGFIRGLIYRELWLAHGYDVQYVSRLYPPLVRFLDMPPRWAWPLMAAGLRAALAALSRLIARIREPIIARTARRYDSVHLVKAASYALVAGIRRQSPARIVIDLVDALWLPRYGIHRLQETLRLVDAVTTDNDLTANYIRSFQPDCTVVPDAPQVESFDRIRSAHGGRNHERCVLGWVGSSGTTHNLYLVWEALERLFARHDHLHLRLLGADPRTLPPFEHVRWSVKSTYTQAEMIDEVLRMDIGIFPLQDVQASHVRGVLKASVYMAGGAAVVASPVGLTPELVRHDETGLLAETTRDWEDALGRLIREPETRRRLADAGLAVVRREFTVERSFQKLIRVLDPPKAEEVSRECVS